MKNENTFELSRFKELAREAVTVMSRMDACSESVDLSPVEEVSKMLGTLKCSNAKEFAANVDEDSLETLRAAAASLKPGYGQGMFRSFMGEIVGTTRNFRETRIDETRRGRARRFLMHVSETVPA